MHSLLGALNRITLDFIYSDLPKLPDMGEEVSTNQLILCLGGGPAAALITAERLGASTKLATSLGDDHISEIARSLLEKETRHYHSFCHPETAHPVNITSVMTFPSRDRSFVSYFPECDFYEQFTDEIYEYLKDAKYCIASDPCEALFRRLKKNGCKIIYDVGWSETMNLKALERVLNYIDVFTPNEKEAMKLTGALGPAEALKMLKGYVETPVVKLGKKGALVMLDQEVVQVPPVEIMPVDSTGAGDAFLGGMAYGLLKNWDIIECVRLGNYSGAKATSEIGCLTAKGSIGEFERLCKKS